ncbi:MAG: Gfo/Idh/MocA family oxidoreductase, partial [Planctomycetota bacterium]
MPDKYRVAVIGHTGRGNYGHGVDTVWLELPQCEIVGVADADEPGLAAAVKRLSAPKGFADYRQMLDEVKPHIVAIGPRWLDQHHAMVLAAAERGMHVYMEKPMCRTLEEADEMAAACEKHNIKLAVAHQTRYSPKLHVVLDMILDGRIGKVLELRGRGKEDRRGGGEDLWVLGSHVMNLMHHIGGEANWCMANVMQDGHAVTKEDVAEGAEGIGPLAGDSLTAMYGMDNGVTAYFASTRNMGIKSRFGLQIFGSEGIIEILTGYLPSVQYLPDPVWSPGQSGAQWI